MGANKYMDEIIDNKLAGIHTAYLAKVLSLSGSTAKIQPLGLKKDSNGKTYAQSPLTKVPIAKHIRRTDPSVSVSCAGGCGNPSAKCSCWQPKIEVGDIVLCICCESNISEAKRGNNVLPPAGKFSMSDSVIIAVL